MHPNCVSPSTRLLIPHPTPHFTPTQGVRTSDDASLTVKFMIFFQLDNLELMLNSTHDPIGDFINALLVGVEGLGDSCGRIGVEWGSEGSLTALNSTQL
eukprot:118728-Chlamydomonas_euryale.AAC.2